MVDTTRDGLSYTSNYDELDRVVAGAKFWLALLHRIKIERDTISSTFDRTQSNNSPVLHP